MARCKDKRKVRTKIASNFRNVWKCMDKKILKPLKKSDFALPTRQKKKLRRAKDARKKRARPLVEEAPNVEAPIVEEAPVLEEEAPMVQKKERRRARQFSREEFPLKGLSVKLKKLPPLPSGRAKLPSNFDWSRIFFFLHFLFI